MNDQIADSSADTTMTLDPLPESSGEWTPPVPTAVEAKRVLIVEDDVGLSNALKIRLEHQGYEVLAAYDGKTGLDYVNRNKPDLALIDLSIPAVNGLSVARSILSTLRTWDMPVLIITGDTSPNVAQYASEIGVKGIFRNPLDTQELIITVRKLLES